MKSSYYLNGEEVEKTLTKKSWKRTVRLMQRNTKKLQGKCVNYINEPNSNITVGLKVIWNNSPYLK